MWKLDWFGRVKFYWVLLWAQNVPTKFGRTSSWVVPPWAPPRMVVGCTYEDTPTITPLIGDILTTHNLRYFIQWHFIQLPCWSESSIGSPYQDLDSLFRLFLGSMTPLTNQHKTFQCVLFSLTKFSRKFLKDHSSHNYSKPNTLSYGILKWWATKKYMHLVGLFSTN